MNIFSAIFYLTSLFLLHLSFIVAYPNFDYKILMNEYGFFALITSLSLSLINFSLKEIIDSFKTIIFAKKVSELDFKQNELVINSIWKYIFYTSVLYSIIVSVIFLSQQISMYLENI
jgi:hypothetical protein